MARQKQQTETASNGSQKPIESALKPDTKIGEEKPDAAKAQLQPSHEGAERIFKVLSRVKRNRTQFKPGDEITLDHPSFDELKRFRVVAGAFEDGEPVKA